VSAEANNEQFDYDDVFKVRHHSTITVGVPALISFVFVLMVLCPPAPFFQLIIDAS
jgi:hypothetical protein